MRSRVLAAGAALLLAAVAGVSQGTQPPAAASPPPWSLTVTPSLDIPLFADSSLYDMGFGARLQADYRLPTLPLLFLGANIGYSFVPVQLAYLPASLSVVGAGANAGVRFDPLPRLSVKAQVAAGGFYGFMHDGSGTGGFGPFVSGGIDASWALLPSLSLGAGAAYRYFVGLYNDLAVTLGATVTFGAGSSAAAQPKEKKPAQPKPTPLEKKPAPKETGTAPGKGLELSQVQLDGVFPAFYKFYNTHAVGRAVLHNWEKEEARDIRVSFLVKQYMDNPKQAVAPAALAPGAEAAIDLFGLFRSNILEVSEPTLVSANVIVEYTVAGAQRRQELTETLRINNRNAMNWEDDQRAAAFVTTRDPTVLKFSRNVTAMLKGKASSALNAKLLLAMGMHEALCLYGLEYVVDPTTPFTEFSQKKDAVDFLQFPQQTLEYKAGDCDDLSILYCAILESVGVDTAFITVPGHIYMAVGLDMSPEEARRVFLRPDDLVFRDGRTWLPLEVTMRDGDFLKAWDAGARQWRENLARGAAELLPVKECWEKYEAVGFSSAVVPITMPSTEQVAKAYSEEVTRFINREISTRVNALQAEAKRAQDPARATNKLGILYAQYGLYDQAEKEFQKLADREYVPALLNMGTLFYARGEARKALAFYQRAQKKEHASPAVLLGIARVNHDLENYGEARAAFAQLKEVDPDLAARFAFIDLRGEEAARAAAASEAKGEMLWAEAK
jgi:tetratricopeptide (TPR) repeat protein